MIPVAIRIIHIFPTIVIPLALTASVGWGQVIVDHPTNRDRQVLDLRIDQQRADSNISENRVTRQAEVSRLEGRLLKLEDKLNTLLRADSTSPLAMIEVLDALARSKHDSTVPQQPKVDAISITTNTVEPANNSASSTDKIPSTWQEHKTHLLQLVAEDYLLKLKIDLASVAIDRTRLQDALRVTEQMGAKGLASQPQVDIKRLEYEHARLQEERLQKMVTGYQRLLDAAIETSK